MKARHSSATSGALLAALIGACVSPLPGQSTAYAAVSVDDGNRAPLVVIGTRLPIGSRHDAAGLEGTAWLLGKTLAAQTALVEQLQARTMSREYDAVCVGVMTSGGTVDAPIGRHPKDRKRQAVHPSGKPAVTHYRVVERFRTHTHVRCRLETGRTHQIRVHLAHRRFPLVGDPVYGGRLKLPAGASEELKTLLREFPRQALHARKLAFLHPASGEAVEFRAPLPDDLLLLIDYLRDDHEVMR